MITNKLLLICQYEVYNHCQNYLHEQLVYNKANAKDRTITKVLVPFLQEPSLTLGHRIFPHSFWEVSLLSCQQVFNYKINPTFLYPFVWDIFCSNPGKVTRHHGWGIVIFVRMCGGEIFWEGGLVVIPSRPLPRALRLYFLTVCHSYSLSHLTWLKPFRMRVLEIDLYWKFILSLLHNASSSAQIGLFIVDGRIIINDKTRNPWKEAVVTYLKIQWKCTCLEGMRKCVEISSQASRHPDWETL